MDSYSSGGEWLIELLAIVLAALIVGFLWWRILSKMGYTGKTRWLLLAGIFFPVTALLEIIWFAFVPWPSLKEFRELKKRVESFKSSGISAIDIEMERLRGEMGMTQMKGRRKPKQ